MRNAFITIILSLLCSYDAVAQAPAAISPVPTENQLNLLKMEMYAFIHFGTNTFTNMEWGNGDASPSVFNPGVLDTDQWAETLKKGGMKGVMLTAKHHDGFCLWPSKFTDYSIRYSPYRDGKGDAVGELEASCKKYDIKLGLYFSPWDRHHYNYGTQGYVDLYKNQLRELLTSYDDIFEIWFDGANGGDGYYGGRNTTVKIDRNSYYDWDDVFNIIRTLAPKAIIHADAADNRWIGNEDGYADETNWLALSNSNFVLFGGSNGGCGDENGTHVSPGEVDVSIRTPNWFWSTTNESKVVSVDKLLDFYYQSVGRNATLLLNMPVDKYGKIPAADSTALVNFYKIIEKTFSKNLLADATVVASNERGNDFLAPNILDSDYDTYWATADGTKTGTLTFTLPEEREINRLVLQEYIPLGQRVKAFKVEYLDGSTWKSVPCEESMTTIGYKRILRLQQSGYNSSYQWVDQKSIKTKQLRISFTNSKGPLCINTIGAYFEE